MDAGESSSPLMFFLPFVGGGHFLPMVDLARFMASHGASSTIVAPHSAAPLLRNYILRDRTSGLPVSLHTLQLPSAAPIDAADMFALPFTDTAALREPLRRLMTERRPDCLVADMFHPWAPGVADELGIPRIFFGGHGCFARCAEDSIRRHAPHEAVGSDSEPFEISGLPDRVQLTRSMLPPFARTRPHDRARDWIGKAMESSFGVLVNSFYELEPAYADYFRGQVVRRAWLVGPACLFNRNWEDKAERGGEKASIQPENCVAWLDSKPPASVLYVCFGSVAARPPPRQIQEIAHGLEDSNHTFIWVLKKVRGKGGREEDDGGCLPEGYEERVVESGKGLIVRGWSPQLLILGHPATGGFMTHCGWNSTTEAVSAGVPVATWPLSAEQFHNENLLTEVLRVGVRVGSAVWIGFGSDSESTAMVGREKVAEAVRRVMGGGVEAAEMRGRMKELAARAQRAVEEGGSSFVDAEALVAELKAARRTRAGFSDD